MPQPIRSFVSVFAVATLICVSAVENANARPHTSVQRSHKPDVADAVAGTYLGSIVSDARGPSGAEVEITVTRVGKNLVEVKCDCERVPTVRIPLMRTSDVIMAVNGPNNFMIELKKDPRRLDMTIDFVTMYTHRA